MALLTIVLGPRRGGHIQSLTSKSLTKLNLFSNVHRRHEESYYWLNHVTAKIKVLNIERDVIGDKTAVEVLKLLSSGLEELILGDCAIMRSALLRLAAGLAEETCTCKRLVIRRCNFDDDSLRVLVGGLRGNSTLEELSVEGNSIQDPTCLARILPTMTSLRYLSLNHNLLTNKGGHALLKGLRNSRSLVKLKIQVQQRTRDSRKIEDRIFRSIYFYNRWNEIEGWTLSTAKEGIWHWALPRLVQKKWPDVIFHLLRKHPNICDLQAREERPRKRGKTER
jgi:hypothetical protein